MELLFILALSFKKGYGFHRIKKLIDEYGSLKKGVEKEGIELSLEIKRAEEEIKKAKNSGTKIVPFTSKSYPEKLLKIPQPPVVLYVKGELKEEPAVVVVGSRRCSSYGRSVAFRLGKFLSENGISVISGLALGIDSAAHRGALSGGGKTVAVLGSGVDMVYPFENKPLAERIVEKGGAVISEFPLGTKARKEFFPRRNRIVSGLSDCVVVVEAAEKSGTFITVNYALEQGKEVLAVPGSIDSPFSRGTNSLIKEGAPPLTDFNEIFEIVPQLKKAKEKKEIPEELAGIYNLLLEKPLTADQISQITGKSPREISIILTKLELKKLISREGATYRAC